MALIGSPVYVHVVLGKCTLPLIYYNAFDE
jgi:hypothetical protein